jgi:hypothetical protein
MEKHFQNKFGLLAAVLAQTARPRLGDFGISGSLPLPAEARGARS